MALSWSSGAPVLQPIFPRVSSSEKISHRPVAWVLSPMMPQMSCPQEKKEERVAAAAASLLVLRDPHRAISIVHPSTTRRQCKHNKMQQGTIKATVTSARGDATAGAGL